MAARQAGEFESISIDEGVIMQVKPGNVQGGRPAPVVPTQATTSVAPAGGTDGVQVQPELNSRNIPKGGSSPRQSPASTGKSPHSIVVTPSGETKSEKDDVYRFLDKQAGQEMPKPKSNFLSRSSSNLGSLGSPTSIKKTGSENSPTSPSKTRTPSSMSGLMSFLKEKLNPKETSSHDAGQSPTQAALTPQEQAFADLALTKANNEAAAAQRAAGLPAHVKSTKPVELPYGRFTPLLPLDDQGNHQQIDYTGIDRVLASPIGTENIRNYLTCVGSKEIFEFDLFCTSFSAAISNAIEKCAIQEDASTQAVFDSLTAKYREGAKYFDSNNACGGNLPITIVRNFVNYLNELDAPPADQTTSKARPAKEVLQDLKETFAKVAGENKSLMKSTLNPRGLQPNSPTFAREMKKAMDEVTPASKPPLETKE